MNNKIKVAVIGATGSVGSSVMSVCRSHKDKIEVRGLAAYHNSKKFKDLIDEFKPELFFNYQEHGLQGLYNLAEDEQVDNIIFASSGTEAIPALQRAAKLNKNISLANKESIVVAGEWVMPLITRKDQLRPLDSEHNAIWQCLHGEDLNLNIIKSI
ncbi:MAG: 1-deoxy-D-xylulose-5-phosphate reductoisomerase, partial [Synergistaceae bacterium]|nr:1-deoxy-D-xylulose-5-phosphate reductoisomerase [Synergistaceae bacterium]